MKLITKNTDYAIRALSALGEHRGKYVSIREVSREQNIPYQFLRKIFQDLINNNIVESKEGGKGGVKLICQPDKINLIEIMKIFQGELQFSECMFRDQLCENRKHCVLRKKIKEAETLVENYFKKVTIKSLMNDIKGR